MGLRGTKPGFQHKDLPLEQGRFIEVGERIREARLYHGISQRQLAIDAKLSKSWLKAWERGHALPSIRSLIRIHKRTGFSLDYLTGLSEKKTVES